jgi:hypothetical protein
MTSTISARKSANRLPKPFVGIPTFGSKFGRTLYEDYLVKIQLLPWSTLIRMRDYFVAIPAVPEEVRVVLRWRNPLGQCDRDNLVAALAWAQWHVSHDAVEDFVMQSERADKAASRLPAGQQRQMFLGFARDFALRAIDARRLRGICEEGPKQPVVMKSSKYDPEALETERLDLLSRWNEAILTSAQQLAITTNRLWRLMNLEVHEGNPELLAQHDRANRWMQQMLTPRRVRRPRGVRRPTPVNPPAVRPAAGGAPIPNAHATPETDRISRKEQLRAIHDALIRDLKKLIADPRFAEVVPDDIRRRFTTVDGWGNTKLREGIAELKERYDLVCYISRLRQRRDYRQLNSPMKVLLEVNLAGRSDGEILWAVQVISDLIGVPAYTREDVNR